MYACEAKDFAQWRTAARPLIATRVRPTDVVWSDWRRPNLFAAANSATVASTERAPSIPRELLTLLEELALYRNASRWDLMYRLAWRVLYENRSLLENDADPDVQTAREWAKSVRRDIHKMHAFVRFHETSNLEGETRYIAWFEPEHEILRAVAPFFEQRFPNMHWMIATPDGAAVWTGTHTEFVDSPARADLPRDDSTHGLWRAYYRNICNVARINPKVMQREMPQRYWRHLPEANEIDALLREGTEIHQRNLHSPTVEEDLRLPRAMSRTLDRIALPAESLQACRQCPLWQHATQAVAGEGPEHAAMMLVGEQPGDEEDVKGRPFLGPAGRLLDEVLRDVEVDRAELYVTNAVKHFKWEPRGKRRLHKRPNQQEVHACGTWLEREIADIGPRVIVALGATAIRAVTGVAFSVEDARQSPLRHSGGATVIATYHPSALLRADDSRRAELTRALRDDLQRAHRFALAS
jgi:probable DNA metabolism protein